MSQDKEQDQRINAEVPNQDATGVSQPEPEIPRETIEAAPGDGTGQPEAPGPEPTKALADLSPEALKAMQEKAAKAEENWDRYLRLNAEFDNFKKRAARDRLEAIRYANEALIEKLLPTLDHFDMAMAAATNPDNVSVDSLKTGVQMVLTQLKSVLSESGLEEIDAAGQAFDPAIHEAVSQTETEEVPDGHVLQQMRKGFRLRDRLLRPASVVVAKRPEVKSTPEEKEEAASDSPAPESEPSSKV